MATLREIVRDITAILDLDSIDRSDIFYKDIVSAVNTSIKNQMQTYVLNGQGERFSVTEDLWFTLADRQYPFLYYTPLQNTPMSLPPDKVFQGANVYKVSQGVANSAQSYNSGKKLIKGGAVYEVTHDVTDTNIYDTTFTVDEIRNYKLGNGLKYFVGDIIKDFDTGNYWQITQDFVENNSTDTVEVGTGEFEEVDGEQVEITETVSFLSTVAKRMYLKLVDSDAYATPTYHPFNHINDIKLYNGINGFYGFTHNGSKLYVTKNIKRMSVSYVPEWTDVINPDEIVDVPQNVITKAKSDTVQRLLPKAQDMQQDIGRQDG